MKTTTAALLGLLAASMSHAEMTLTSPDVTDGGKLSKQQEYKGFGCDGGNQSPELEWRGAPEGTKSFAITAYDPDAPTGSGWWHWQVINVPADINKLERNVGVENSTALPKGAQQIETDYGSAAFGGACPPAGDKPHRYQFKVYALGVEKIDLPADSSSALVGYYIHANMLDSAVIEATYQR
ncbi:YbhB/YbcL family Raf kinase inhibitor-like protein [Hahella sp. KA22]|uniref:YbhB/YbcL family Raf kinase inhibitor-like protein n=1 Tax=Hahella sp. KA22 TaxID=1628392 RepID=UPI000FDDF6DB|nr:YbhB/YbcL family Raf kinase inhibitor-like protein [Hahella sp. KA22]AZZ91233.1 YbhB/YbcL family Raf kinase inhibitor-like protein [Hahella sp. KA22]QAY54601.1 YbhB/YbcL family Raf kinase inhibitor-like protein [Hahella sp. KA22]